MCGTSQICFLLLALSYTAFGGPSITVVLRNAVCKKSVLAQIRQWEKAEEWIHSIAASQSYRAPTTKLGVWLELEVSESAVLLSRVTREETTTIQWKKENCRPDLSFQTYSGGDAPSDDIFTDQSLRDLMDNNSRGIIYAWSPQMPISVLGKETIRKVARATEVPVFFVLDPKTSSAESTDRRIESIELFERGILNHFPSVVLFSKGKISSPVIPGFLSDDYYAKYITEYTLH